MTLGPKPTELSLTEPARSTKDFTKDSFPKELKTEIITYMETVFWETSAYPEKKVVAARFHLSMREVNLALNLTEAALTNRGLPSPLPKNRLQTLEGRLDPTFVLACNAITNSVDKRSTAAKLKAIGVTPQQWQGFLANKAYFKYFSERMDDVFGKTEQAAKAALMKNVESGDLQSVKFYYELTNKYRPSETTALNLTLIISQLMEILAGYVTQDVLEAIATKFDSAITANSTTTLEFAQ